MIWKRNRLSWSNRAWGNRASRNPNARLARSQYRTYRAVHPFDERYGVDTGELIYDLPGSGNSHRSNNGYCGVPPSVFHRIMERLNDSLASNWSRFTFIDLGSGKGRALLLASGCGFKKVIGVEITPRLEEIAQRNIKRFASVQPGSPIFASLADAAEFVFPQGPLLVYMWNAFSQPVLDRVVAHLRESYQRSPREIYIVYIDPDLEATFAINPWFERLWTGAFELSAEDYEAWAFPDHTELCSAYRLVTPR